LNVNIVVSRVTKKSSSLMLEDSRQTLFLLG
jgi:hypothetical protein